MHQGSDRDVVSSSEPIMRWLGWSGKAANRAFPDRRLCWMSRSAFRAWDDIYRRFDDEICVKSLNNFHWLRGCDKARGCRSYFWTNSTTEVCPKIQTKQLTGCSSRLAIEYSDANAMAPASKGDGLELERTFEQLLAVFRDFLNVLFLTSVAR